MANDGSIAFGEPLVWMLTQPGASGKCRCRTSSHETNFKKVANSRGLRCTLLSFFYLAGTLPASASIASSCGASILMKRHVAPKTKSHHTLAMCGKEHPTRDPACATSTRVTFPWDFRRWISSHQWAQSKDWTAVKIARRLRRIFRTGVPDQRQDIQWIIDKTVLKLLVRISKQNLLAQFAHFLNKHFVQCIKVHLVACIDIPNVWPLMNHLISEHQLLHANVWLRIEQPQAPWQTSSANLQICGFRDINSHIKETDYVLHIATYYPRNCSLFCIVLLLTLNLPVTPLGLNVKMHVFGRQTKTRIPTTWDWKVTTLRH